MEVLVTNDDGYDSPGLHAVADALEDAGGSITILAPADDQSEVGRRRSDQVQITERDRGFAVEGTPADCVIVGLEALELSPDLVVAGCNVGANLGAYALGRSGTISAAVEAAFFDVPAIALSLYVPDGQWPLNADPDHFSEAVRAVRYLAPKVVDTDIVNEGGYLNVNAPFPDDTPAGMRVTRPSDRHALTAEPGPGRVEIVDETWRHMAEGRWSEGPATDRGAVMRGCISVSPLTAPHRVTDTADLEAVVDGYDPENSSD